MRLLFSLAVSVRLTRGGPKPQGDRHQQCKTIKEDRICPIAFPEIEILVSPLLGPS
jgi:hypothetical protein